MSQDKIDIKNIVVVGDGAVGKTSLLYRFHNDDYNDEYQATVYEESEFVVEIEGKRHIVKLHDTAGQEGYERLRKVIYSMADIFLLCYSVEDRQSFFNVQRWASELRKECKDVPIVLCATKTDLRSTVLNCVTTMEGQDMRMDIKAKAFVECSSLSNQGVKNAIHTTIKTMNAEVEDEQECKSSHFCCCCIPSFMKKYVKVR
uniref:CSON013930 protein n=1 Tax=Culicoides sonorensis TaxID=179676 RepID=A0A336MCT3_CULSO